MTYIFDGKSFANTKLDVLVESVSKLKKQGIIPKLVSIIIGDNPGGLFYANLKKNTAAKIGIEVEIKEIPESTSREELIKIISELNKDKLVHGIMLQLPLPKKFSESDVEEILDSIDSKKDVDGLGKQSDYLMPTVKASLMIMREAEEFTPVSLDPHEVVVVGHTGFEGGGIYKALKEMGFGVTGANSKTKDLWELTLGADILISATGVPGLISNSMVKEGVVIIDVGSPKGDVEKEAYEKASFVSPVPGGVGPVTVSCLMENIVLSAESKLK